MTTKTQSRLRELTEDYLRLEEKLKLGGGPEKIEILDWNLSSCSTLFREP